MQRRVNVDTELKAYKSDVVTLTDYDSNKSISLISTDSEGNFNHRSFSRAPLQRTSIVTSSATAENQYSDVEKPWASLAQDDWSGGRGNKLFHKDTTRFYDSKRAQSAFTNKVFNAPLDYYSEMRDAVTNHPRSLRFIRLDGFYSQEFTPDKSLSIGEIYLHLKKKGKPTGDFTVSISASQDGTEPLATVTYSVSDFTDTLAEFYKKVFETVSITANKYYFTITSNVTGDTDNCIMLGVTSKQTDATFPAYHGTSFNDVTLQNYEIIYRLSPAQTGIRTKFFYYQQLQFCIRQSANGTPRLFVNGGIFKATAATNNSLTIGSNQWSLNQWAGCQLGLVYGKGVDGQITVWKKILSNTLNTVTIDGTFEVTPDTTTAFIITDTPLWTEITGHGLTSFVTDILVIRGMVYFCQGDYVDSVRMYWNGSSLIFQSMTGVKASFMTAVRDAAGLMLWKGNNDDSQHNRSVQRALLTDAGEDRTLVTVTTALTPSSDPLYTESVDFEHEDYDGQCYEINVGTFSSNKGTGVLSITLQGSENNTNFVNVRTFTGIQGTGLAYEELKCKYRYRRFLITATGTNTNVNNITIKSLAVPHFGLDKITLLDNYGKITGLREYGSSEVKTLWIMQEGMVSSVNRYDTGSAVTYTLDRINLDELERTAEEWNASTTETSDVYLLFSWLNGVQRYFNSQLEGRGADKDEGLPIERRGRVSKLLSYPSHFFCSVDGEDGYSSVLMYNNSGWHEIYRAPNKGERIRDIDFQPIYGYIPDRLWIAVGDDIVWLAMPSKTLEAVKDTNALYSHESVIVSSWLNAGMTDIEKLWGSIKIDADNLNEDECWIEADYQLEENGTWFPIENYFVNSPSQKEDFKKYGSVNSKKLRYRLRMQTTDITKTPVLNAVIIECVGRVDIKYSYSFTVRNIKYKADLSGEYEDIEPLEVQNILDDWANRIVKLKLNSVYKIFNDKDVFLDGTQTSVLNELSEGYITQIVLNEL